MKWDDAERRAKAQKARKKLEKYTKDELLRMIEEVCYIDTSASYWFMNETLTIENERSEARLQAEGKAGDEWIRLLKEYEDCLRPYAGMKFKDIPTDVLVKANTLAKQADKAKEKYMAYFDMKDGE